jgi:hypothetical protein
MRWFQIKKDSKNIPDGIYKEWKEQLSIEGQHQCVYCAININSFGGIRNFHVEHYKPKAKGKFPELENDYYNVFFACSICNGFKGDDWKEEPRIELDNNSYPNPLEIDYSIFLKKNKALEIESDFITGNYIINKIYLNRPQLILERKIHELFDEIKNVCERTIEVLLMIAEIEGANPVITGYIESEKRQILLIQGLYINPYLDEQIKR